MRTTTALGRLAALALALGMLGFAAGGCDNPFKPRIGYAPVAVEPAPRPNSPQGLMKLFRWCWVNRSIAEYEDLFTEDFRFVFSDVDAVDNPPILRDEEIAIARRIFVDGNANEPRAKRIELTFVNEPLIPIADTRRGKTDPWHKLIQTRVTLRVELADEAIQIDGDLNFYVVRGDSALIPEEMRQRGFGPDPGRWYIERWEDKTGGGGTGSSVVRVLRALARAESPSAASLPAAALPVASRGGRAVSGQLAWSWGELKLLFRE